MSGERYSQGEKPPSKPLTKKRFLRILEKVVTSPAPHITPSRKKPSLEASETSESHRPDDCNETYRSPDTLEGTSG